MNKMYAQRNGIPVDKGKDTEAVKLVKELAERDRQSKERSAQIINHYTNRPQDGTRI